ncbi:MAG TPA: mevalonate kinase [Sorangium sp.]|nr:mevalonate kinase [Sorangium sp.]
MTEVVASGRAHGKIILFGEHAVVHGVPALVCGISHQLQAHARRLSAGPSRLQLLQRHTDVASQEELARALAALLALAPRPPPLQLTVSGELPPGVGLGFSASAAVALARAVEATVGDPVDEHRVALRAHAWESIFHGNPSGVDVAAAMHSGCLHYVRGQQPEPVDMGAELLLVVGQTGIRSSTRKMVAAVTARLNDHPADGAARLNSIAALVAQGRAHIEAGRVAALGPLLVENQRQLTALGASCDSIQRMCELATSAGALGAKLTGAGGGGSVIALVDDVACAARVKQTWQQAGFMALTTKVGATPATTMTS